MLLKAQDTKIDNLQKENATLRGELSKAAAAPAAPALPTTPTPASGGSDDLERASPVTAAAANTAVVQNSEPISEEEIAVENAESIPEAVASSYDASEPADHTPSNANPAADNAGASAGTTGSTPLVQQDTEVPTPLVQLPAAVPTTEEANRGQPTNKKRVKLTGKQQHLRNVKTRELVLGLLRLL